jgi:hypothetical protein
MTDRRLADALAERASSLFIRAYTTEAVARILAACP